MIAAVLILLAPAEVPNVVTLSAVLEENGVPVSRTVAASFVLWDDPSGGAAVWSDGDDALDVTDGVLVAELGAHKPLPAGTFTRPLWLEIVVDGQALSPRARIASVPYALEAAHAADASTLDGLDVDDIVALAAAPVTAGPGDSVLLYEAGPACPLPGTVTRAPTCSARACTGGYMTCAGTCAAASPTTCDNAVLGRALPP